jgi:hypothetical protein
MLSVTTTRNGAWVWGVGCDPQSDRAYPPEAGLNQVINAADENTYDLQQHWVSREEAPTPTAGTRAPISATLGARDIWELAIVEILPSA